jgi:hypothetical protein
MKCRLVKYRCRVGSCSGSFLDPWFYFKVDIRDILNAINMYHDYIVFLSPLSVLSPVGIRLRRIEQKINGCTVFIRKIETAFEMMPISLHQPSVPYMPFKPSKRHPRASRVGEVCMIRIHHLHVMRVIFDIDVVLNVTKDNGNKSVERRMVDRGKIWKKLIDIPHQLGSVVLLGGAQSQLREKAGSFCQCSHHRVINNLVLDKQVLQMPGVGLADVGVVRLFVHAGFLLCADRNAEQALCSSHCVYGEGNSLGVSCVMEESRGMATRRWQDIPQDYRSKLQ